jgi:hypothetical protein
MVLIVKKKHGGRRAGSGRPSFFRGKYARAERPLYKKTLPPTTMVLTPQARKLLDAKCKALTRELQQQTQNPKARVSRNVVMEALVRLHGSTLTLSAIRRADK